MKHILQIKTLPGIKWLLGMLLIGAGTADAFDNSDLNLRNSFHWGPRQFAALSSTNLSLLTSNDFLKGEMHHWLITTNKAVGSTVSLQREPSPDSAGMTEGQKIWYDYAGKTNSEYEGTQPLPLYMARVLPDGTTAFVRTDRNNLGNVQTNISTYSANGTAAYRTNMYTYSTNGIDLLTITNALGVQVVSNAYNAYHEVVTNFNALGEMTTFAYNTNQQVTQIITPTGLVTTNTYGTSNLLTTSVVVGFATNSFTYTNDLVLTRTDPRGLATTNYWDNLNRLTGTSYPDGSSISNIYTILDLTSSKDRLGNYTYFVFDNMRRNTYITNVLKQVTGFGYCTCGALASMMDAAGSVTSYFYDNQGNRTNIVYPDFYATTNAYNLLRQVVTASDSSRGSVNNVYNNQGLVASSANAAGLLVTNQYDALDRVTNSTDVNGVTVSTTFDNLNRPLARAYPDNGVESFGYTANYAGATAYTNQIGNVKLFGYDALNRTTNEAMMGVMTNQYVLSGPGDLLQIIDGKLNATTFGYDTFGRRTSKTDAASNLILTNQYDPDNRLTNRWSAAKGTTTYKFDALGNLTNVTYPVSPSIGLVYDNLNRLTNMVDAAGTNGFSYDSVGELLSEDGPWANDAVTYTNKNRERIGMSLVQPNGPAWAVSYGYDNAWRLTNVTSTAGAFGYTYDPLRKARVSQLTLPGGAAIANSYDAVARMLSTALRNSGNTVLDAETYGYNQGNQRTSETNLLGDYRNYIYDPASELISAIGKEASGVTNRWQEQLGYGYDAGGNLNYRTNNTLVQQFNLNSLNELTTVTNGGTFTVVGTTITPATNVTVNTSNAVLYADATFASTNQPWVNGNNTFTAIAQDAYGHTDTNSISVNLSGTNGYAYDLNGNLLSDGTHGFDYDDENELIRITVTNQFKREFVYDGRRRLRIELQYGWIGTWSETNELRYVYDGNAILQIRDMNDTPTLTLTRGLDLSGTLQGAGGIGGLVAMTEASGTHSYYHCDGNGNVVALMNSSQYVDSKALYDPFGNFLSISGSKTGINPFWFSSELYEDGFYYFPRRVYVPELQRWPNRDPLEEQAGLNLYNYAGNNPANNVDPLGLDFWQSQYSFIYPNNPRYTQMPDNPNINVAVQWLNKCHSELFKNKVPPVFDIPGISLIGEEGNSIIPGIILIDVPRNSDVSHIVETIAHEGMHKRDGFWHGEWDYWFNDEAEHNKIFNDANMIKREYDKDPTGKNCKCK